MVDDRNRILLGIEPGDVLFATTADGAPKIVLVHQRTDTRILTRLVTSQTRIEFGLDGKSSFVDGDYSCEIVSAAPLPVHEYNVVRGLDRKMRLGQQPDGFRLSKDEQRLLIEIGDFYKAHPLPRD